VQTSTKKGLASVDTGPNTFVLELGAGGAPIENIIVVMYGLLFLRISLILKYKRFIIFKIPYMFSLHQLEFTCLKEDTLGVSVNLGDDVFIAYHRRSLSGLTYKKVI